jgi:hypothetical protein
MGRPKPLNPGASPPLIAPGRWVALFRWYLVALEYSRQGGLVYSQLLLASGPGQGVDRAQYWKNIQRLQCNRRQSGAPAFKHCTQSARERAKLARAGALKDQSPLFRQTKAYSIDLM